MTNFTSRLIARVRRTAGYSMTEATVVMGMVATLSGAAAPTINSYLDDARLARAQGDVRVIATSFVRLTGDLGAASRQANGWRTYDLLVGPGEAPTAADGASAGWAQADARVGQLGDHLVANAPGYRLRSAGSHGWRGPYVSGLDADPWGTRYAINVQPLVDRTAALVVVMSAGPDGIAQTPFGALAPVTGSDDIVAVIGPGGPNVP